MRFRSAVASALLVGAAVSHAPGARAERGQAARHGAIVVAVGEGSGPAARALAREVYRDARLRPPIDEATARVLAGEAPPADPPAKLADLAKVRASLGSASEADAGSTDRRVLASIGAELGAELVVPVVLRGDRPVARAVHVEGASVAPVEILATLPAEGAAPEWPGAVAVLRTIVPTSPPAPSTGPATASTRPSPAAGAPVASARTAASPPASNSRRTEKPSKSSVFGSPFFWGSLGAVAAVSIGVFVASRVAAESEDTFLVQGRVPR